MLLDIDTLLVEEVTRCLKAATDDELTPVRTDGKLYYAEEQWMACVRQWEQDGLRQREQDVHGSGSSGGGAQWKRRARECRGSGTSKKEGGLGSLSGGERSIGPDQC